MGMLIKELHAEHSSAKTKHSTVATHINMLTAFTCALVNAEQRERDWDYFLALTKQVVWITARLIALFIQMKIKYEDKSLIARLKLTTKS